VTPRKGLNQLLERGVAAREIGNDQTPSSQRRKDLHVPGEDDFLLLELILPPERKGFLSLRLDANQEARKQGKKD
jgi:hypothetical protein